MIAKSRIRLDEVGKIGSLSPIILKRPVSAPSFRRTPMAVQDRQIPEHVMSQEEPCDNRSLLQKRLKYKRTKRFGTSSARSRKCEDIKSAVIGAAKGKAHSQQKDVSQCEE